jgi:hypothetical protein
MSHQGRFPVKRCFMLKSDAKTMLKTSISNFEKPDSFYYLQALFSCYFVHMIIKYSDNPN